MISYNLLMTDSPEEAEEIAMLLEQKNSERQRLTEKAMSKAKEQVSTQLTQPILIAADRDYPAGIMGLVAGRLSEAHYRPVIVISTGEQMSSGSCRSIPEFNIILALNQCHKLLKEFGGHSQAAGFTLPTKNLPRFKAALLNAVEAELSGVDLQPSLTIDTEIALPDLAGDTIRSIYRLAPFGQGNPQPAFLSRAVEVIQCSPMGNNGGHIRLKLRQGNTMWQAVGFGLGSFRSEVSSHLDIVYNLEKDRWRGEERLRLNILDFMPATQDGR